MWRRRHGTRAAIPSSPSSSTSTSREDFDNDNDDDDVIGLMTSSKSTTLVAAQSPQVQYQCHEAQSVSMKETIRYLQHRLDIATDRIAAFAIEKGDITLTQKGIPTGETELDAVNDSVNRKLREVQFKNGMETALRNVTAQASVMLEERRDMQADLSAAKDFAVAAEKKLEDLVDITNRHKREILAKLKAMQKLIVFDRKYDDDEDDDDNDGTSDEANTSCMLALFNCWSPPKGTESSGNRHNLSAGEKTAEHGSTEILLEIKELHKLLNRKVNEFHNNSNVDASAIDTLKATIVDNNRKLAKRGKEIESLKTKLDETTIEAANVATQHAQLTSFYAQVKSKLQVDINDTDSNATVSSFEAATQHSQEGFSPVKARLHTDLEDIEEEKYELEEEDNVSDAEEN